MFFCHNMPKPTRIALIQPNYSRQIPIKKRKKTALTVILSRLDLVAEEEFEWATFGLWGDGRRCILKSIESLKHVNRRTNRPENRQTKVVFTRMYLDGFVSVLIFHRRIYEWDIQWYWSAIGNLLPQAHLKFCSSMPRLFSSYML